MFLYEATEQRFGLICVDERLHKATHSGLSNSPWTLQLTMDCPTHPRARDCLKTNGACDYPTHTGMSNSPRIAQFSPACPTEPGLAYSPWTSQLIQDGPTHPGLASSPRPAHPGQLTPASSPWPAFPGLDNSPLTDQLTQDCKNDFI